MCGDLPKAMQGEMEPGLGSRPLGFPFTVSVSLSCWG